MPGEFATIRAETPCCHAPFQRTTTDRRKRNGKQPSAEGQASPARADLDGMPFRDQMSAASIHKHQCKSVLRLLPVAWLASPAGADLNGSDTQRPDVCSLCVPLLAGLNDLRRHPVGGSHKGVALVAQRACSTAHSNEGLVAWNTCAKFACSGLVSKRVCSSESNAGRLGQAGLAAPHTALRGVWPSVLQRCAQHWRMATNECANLHTASETYGQVAQRQSTLHCALGGQACLQLCTQH